MAHNRKLVLGGVGLTKARLPAKINGPAMDQVRDEIEREMIQSGYLEGAPFKYVGLMIRKGLIDETEPHYERINKTYGDLPLAIEVDTHRLLGASMENMAAIYRRATLLALLHAGEKYGLKVDRIRTLLEEAI